MLRWNTSPRGAETHVLLYGELNEIASLGDLAELRGGVALDLAGITRVNSEGLRELIGLLDRLRQRGATVWLERCAPTFIGQLNLMPGLAGVLQVRSVLAPLECPSCLQEAQALVLTAAGARPPVPATACDECGAPMTLAEPTERFFAFLLGSTPA